MGLLYAVDLGNTTVSCALFEGARIVATWRLATHTGDLAAGFRARLMDALRAAGSSVDAVMISSVVPGVLPVIKQVACEVAPETAVYVLGENCDTGVPNEYADPQQVGQDRLVNALAAHAFIGGPAVVVDFGTAVTFDVVAATGAYVGGIIVPGVEVALDALASAAALLPRVGLAPPGPLIGRETTASMLSGSVYGYAALCDGLIERIDVARGARHATVATGGHATLIAPWCRRIQTVNPQLTLQGLALVYQRLTVPGGAAAHATQARAVAPGPSEAPPSG